MKLRVLIAVPLLVFVALVVFKSCGGPVSAGAHSVQLTWNAAVPPAGATWVPSGYNIYRSTTPGGYTIGVHLNTAVVPGTTFTDNTVAAGQTYYYAGTTWCQVCTVGQQESAFSNEVKAVAPADVVGPPNPPTAFAAPVVQ